MSGFDFDKSYKRIRRINRIAMIVLAGLAGTVSYVTFDFQGFGSGISAFAAIQCFILALTWK
jgi:hypothetical protein